NNLALLGLARQLAPNGKHLISNRAEHHAVLHTLEYLQKREGFEVTWLDLSSEGLIDPEQLKAAIRPETILVSIMTANNETGVIQLLDEIAEICRARGVLLHSDMVQSFGKMESSLTNIDAAAFAAHKFYGPKGAGLLYLRAGLPLAPVQFGGAHEGERRPGTENVAAIAGMAAAAQFISENPPEEAVLRDQLWEGIMTIFPEAEQNGAGSPRLANTLNVSFPGHSSETLLMALDLEGVCASSGSACMVGSVVASHVLLAMGLTTARAASAIRFSLGKETAATEISQTISALERIFQRFRPHAAVASRPHALV
ncbi:MAG TPA: cysteine desulfurase family protein, partial [Chthoniobacterales bacterium]